MKNIIKSELSGWKPLEIAWLFIACSIITGLSLYWGDTLMGIISSTTGVACVVCTGKGKLSAYLFGLINCVLYAIIAFNAQLYGEFALNATYYIFAQFWGFFTWKRNINQDTYEVKKRNMTWKQRGLLAAVIAAGSAAFGLVLKLFGGEMPFIDAFTTVASVVAMFISVKMYSEQWYLWVIINIASIGLWVNNVMQGTDNWATLMMWSVYLINAIVMLVKWEKEAYANRKEKANAV